MSMSSANWRRVYEWEWEALTSAGMPQEWRSFPELELPARGCVVFPHTRLRYSARQIVPVAAAIARQKVRKIVALGPLHGGIAESAELVRHARAGSEEAIGLLRGIYRAGDTFAAEEFCLDNLRRLTRAFGADVDIAGRHPFLTGGDPMSINGMEDLLATDGLAVATADPIHHGVGYGTPPGERRAADDAATASWAEAEVNRAFQLLAERDYAAFAAHARSVNSDFRDVGPVLREMLPGTWRWRIESMSRVPYEDLFAHEAPTWVAAPLVVVERG